MAEIAQPGIKNSWSLVAFARANGKMSVLPAATHINKSTGEEFTAASCAFTHPTEKDDQGRSKVCFVGFSRNLGELTPAQISEQKDSLRVVEFENGNYSLCKEGSSAWQDVDLGI